MLNGIVQGSSLKAIAAERGSTEGTVRSQVKSVLAKTGRRGLRSVIVDVLRSAPIPLDDPGAGAPTD